MQRRGVGGNQGQEVKEYRPRPPIHTPHHGSSPHQRRARRVPTAAQAEKDPSQCALLRRGRTKRAACKQGGGIVVACRLGQRHKNRRHLPRPPPRYLGTGERYKGVAAAARDGARNCCLGTTRRSVQEHPCANHEKARKPMIQKRTTLGGTNIHGTSASKQSKIAASNTFGLFLLRLKDGARETRQIEKTTDQ